jgi:hypothetical protein
MALIGQLYYQKGECLGKLEYDGAEVEDYLLDKVTLHIDYLNIMLSHDYILPSLQILHYHAIYIENAIANIYAENSYFKKSIELFEDILKQLEVLIFK